MAPRYRSPDRSALRSQHLMRVATVAGELTGDVPTDGFKMALRIARRSGCKIEDMAELTQFTAQQLEEWSVD